ncbi:MAG: hypothetical protein AB1793_00215 [Candidatus Thermoplasmatota archaeon]
MPGAPAVEKIHDKTSGTGRFGMDQLSQLNAMERGQDSTTWSTNALHSATNGVLIVAAVSALNHPEWAMIIMALSVLGMFISTAWFLIILRAQRYEIEWIHRALWLQRAVTMREECAVWQEGDSAFRPQVKGIPSSIVLHILISGFYFMWVIVLGIAIGSIDVDASVRGVIIVIAAITTLAVYYFLFWRQMNLSGKFKSSLVSTLGLDSPRNREEGSVEQMPIADCGSSHQEVKGMDESNSAASKNDFSIITGEIQRQFDQESRNCESLDSKTGVMLGFVFVSLGLIVSLTEPVADLDSGSYVGHFGILGVISLLVAAFLGVIAFFVREFKGGADIGEIIDIYRKGEPRDYEMIISRKLYDSFLHNHRQNVFKAWFAKGMFIAFLIGLVLVVVWNLDRIWG